MPVADEPYYITCTATKAVGGGTLSVVWRDSDGRLVKSIGDLTVGDEVVSSNTSNVTLEFAKVRVDSKGEYVCDVSLALEDFDYTAIASTSYKLVAPGTAKYNAFLWCLSLPSPLLAL